MKKKPLKKPKAPHKRSKHFAAPQEPRALSPLEAGPACDAAAANAPARLIDRAEVERRIPFSYPTIWKWMQQGNFPRSLNAGGKIVWREDEVDQWIKTRPRQMLKGDKVAAAGSEVSS